MGLLEVREFTLHRSKDMPPCPVLAWLASHLFFTMKRGIAAEQVRGQTR